MKSTRPGYTLFEILFVIVMAGFFLLMASRAFTQTHQLMKQTQAQSNDASRWDGVTRQLRNDCWLSHRIEPGPLPQSVTLHLPDERVVTWYWPEGADPIQRDEHHHQKLINQKHWPAMKDVTLHMRPGAAVLQLPHPDITTQEVYFPSQLQLIKAMQ
jgi:hypothetical protein